MQGTIGASCRSLLSRLGKDGVQPLVGFDCAKICSLARLRAHFIKLSQRPKRLRHDWRGVCGTLNSTHSPVRIAGSMHTHERPT